MNEWTIPGLLQLSGGYWATCALHAGVKLDIFTMFDQGALRAADAAGLRGANVRATAMLLDSLAALGLLHKQGDTYETTPFAAATLSRNAPGYLGHIIMHHHHLVAGWERLDEAVINGGPVRSSVSHGNDEQVRESFLMGMFNLASQLAPRIASAVDLSRCRSLLDLGGGPGTYAIHFCLANPDLTAVVYDLPTTRAFAEGTVERFALSDRVTFASGDFHKDPVPAGFDAVWLSHVLHSDGYDACAALLKKAAAALNPGGVVMVQEFILNNEKNGPEFPALFSLNMLIGTSTGQSYSDGEIRTMCEGAGLVDITRLPADLPNGAGIITGRKQ